MGQKRPRGAAQLQLFASSEPHPLAAENAYLRQRLETAKQEYRTLRSAKEASERERDDARKERDSARRERDTARQGQRAAEELAILWQSLARQSQQGTRTRGGGSDAALDTTLKQLLALIHPDKWSQGQPATELAHELAIVINKIRDKGGRRP
jgi:hypothetical protein